MTADSGSGQAPSNAKYLLLLVVVVLAPVIFTWFTTSQGKSDADFDRLLNAGKTYYDSGEAQKAIDAFTQALQHKPTETDLLLNLANAHRLAGQPAEVIKYAGEALAIDNNQWENRNARSSCRPKKGQKSWGITDTNNKT